MKNKTTDSAFKDYIIRENLFKPDDRLLVAVSGGIDSVVLCHLCHANGFDFHIAHCNFKLRGAESEADAAFVKDLAARYQVSFFQKEFDTANYAEENKLSTQVAARELRYKWFAELLENKEGKPLKYLLTAHHADDNTETILMNFFKGTGINGLKGILPKKEKIVRPLLFAKKSELLEYAAIHNLAYREDSSNASDKYTRNFFRNTLIPSIEKVFPAATENLASNAARFRDIHLIYNQAVEGHLKKLVFAKGQELHLPVLKWRNTAASKTLMFELVKDFGFSAAQSDDVMHLLESETGKYVSSNTHRIYRYHKWLIISELNTAETESFLIEEGQKEIDLRDFVLQLQQQTMPVSLVGEKDVALLDMKSIKYPLILRKRKPGDYFYPLGMRKKKKLGRFLSDEKLSLSQKENCWVIESDKKIIWVVGYRIDDRFKVSDQTKHLLKINRLSSK